ncbi:MAG: hypothetical protein V9E94_12080 [Microthrixaceae bacterium]
MVPLFAGLLVVLAAACAPPPAAPKGIVFNPPTTGYVGQQYVPKATAPNSLPISFSLDATSTGCSLAGGVLSFDAVGTCVVLASQTGDDTTTALPTVRRTIRVYECPTLRSGRWTGPQGSYADVVAGASTFSGTANLAVLGLGVQPFAGTKSCEVLQMTFNGVALSGKLSFDGARINASYSGIAVVLNAPPA